MSPAEAVAVLAAGIGAGTINTIVGSGTLITFPVLLAVGLPPVTANVSNTLGLVPGSVAGAIGYRGELAGQRGRLLRLGGVCLVGGAIGAILLVNLPSGAFHAIVPVLIALALVLVVLQPRLTRALQASRQRSGSAAPVHGGPVLLLGLFLASIYGGYFGAAQGVIYMSLMGVLLDESLQRINGLKNVLAAMVNGIAALFFVVIAHMDWVAVALVAAGATIGGLIGARVGRRLPPMALRGLIVAVGIAAIVQLLLK
jgi:uncharacterized membrane protein YfcA